MKQIRKMTICAICLALGLILPFFTGSIPQIGSMLLPVMLCGLLCGWKYGLLCGLIVPILRSALFGMPVLYPMALAMAFELAAYGAICGLIYGASRWKCLVALYRALFASMIGGRIVFGLAMMVLMGIKGGAYTWQAFVAGAITGGIPGMVLQLVLIPLVMLALAKTHMVPGMQFTLLNSRRESC